MAKLTWSVEIKVSDASVARTESTADVERDWKEVSIPAGKAGRRVPVEKRKEKMIFFQVKAKGAGVELKAGKQTLPLDKPVLFMSDVRALQQSGKTSYHILRSLPESLEFTNKSKDPVMVDIQSFWKVQAAK